jgi:zinc transport system substrate-binding protein
MFKKLKIIGFITCYVFALNTFAKDTIIVSVPPQKYFIEQIAHDNFNIQSMMDEDSILPSYLPTYQQYLSAEEAIAYFKIGMFDEKEWIHKIKVTNKNIKVFDTTLNIKKSSMSPYIWLDPCLVKIQAKNILNILTKLDNKNKSFYKKNYFKFVNKISRLDYQIKVLFKKNEQNYFMVFDPVWDYFTKRYDIKQIEINADPFSTNKDNIISILNQLNRYKSNIVFIPKYYFPKRLYKSIVSNTKVVVVPFSHLTYDWENNILSFAKLIAYQPR